MLCENFNQNLSRFYCKDPLIKLIISYLLLLNKNRFVKWLFVPVKDQARLVSIQVLKSNDPGQCLNLISKMMSLTDRIDLQAARVWFDELRRHSNIGLKPALKKTIDAVINDEISPEVVIISGRGHGAGCWRSLQDEFLQPSHHSCLLLLIQI